ncbi:ABC transporter ATP-binding protein [Gordonia metallireducens]|uniref:ABC transporter ATP-binding protein n=1 Tax=Gordonia metallireducens TaxID=2897779 RepID=UPI001E630D9F|nr:ABC transporter ATP-binding protein [Gordonia metallireducens]
MMHDVDETTADGQDPGHPTALSLRMAIRRFRPLLTGLRWRLVAAILCYLVHVATTVVTVAVFAHIVDDVLITGDLSALLEPMIVWIAASLIGAAASYGGAVLTGGVTEKLLLRLRDRLYLHTQRLAPHARHRFGTGDLVSRNTSDVEAVDSLLSSGVVTAAVTVVSLIVYAVAAFVTQWQLALTAAILAPVLWLIARRFGVIVKRASRRERSAAGRISSLVAEGVANAPAIQAAGQLDRDRRRVRRQSRRWRDARMSEIRADAAFSEAVTVVEVLCMIAVVVLGAWQISAGTAELGTLIALTGYLGYLYPQIQTLGGLVVDVTAATASAERVAQVLDAPVGVAETLDGDDVPPGPVASAVSLTLDGVSFAYPQTDSTVLDDVQLDIEAGDLVAITGPSGAGKSTLTYLLLRFYDPVAGAILLNGNDIRTMDAQTLRAHMAVLHQRPALMSGSIAENIAFGRTDVTREQIVAAADLAGATPFIRTLPGGFDAAVVERGDNLSGGQQQRIALARAFLRDAPLLILDEPTTGLDAETVDEVLEPLARLASSRTTVMITHDPRVLAIADRRIELRDGRFHTMAPAA